MENMWITVEKTPKTGDYFLGISNLKMNSSLVITLFPHRSAQAFKFINSKTARFTSKKFCNYKKVILVSHFFTTVTTTNFKYKYFFLNEPYIRQIEAAL